MLLAAALLLAACGDREPDAAPLAEPLVEAAAAEAPAKGVASPEPEPMATRRPGPWKPVPLLVPADARDALLEQAVEAEQAGRFFGDEPLGALELYSALADADPPLDEAQVGRERVILALADQFEAARLAGRLDEAEAIGDVLVVVQPESQAARVTAIREARLAEATVATGRERQAEGRWLSPRGDNAVFHFRAALEQVAGFAPATAGLDDIAQGLMDRAANAAGESRFDDAEADLRRAARLGRRSAAVQDARAVLSQARSGRAAEAMKTANEALDRLDLSGAARGLEDAEAADPQAAGIDELAQRLANARRYGHFLPGQVFVDALNGGGEGPAMVVIPHGAFVMGAAEDEGDARDNEYPSRRVRFDRGFALARHEVTVGEFARFIAATDYRTAAERAGTSSSYDERGGAMVDVRGAHWRRNYLGRAAAEPNDPVIHIAFADATAYADWLSARTGQRYRLPSEAEFEYVLRAGNADAWPWGKSVPARAVANLTGDGEQSPRGRRWGLPIRDWSDGHWGPAPAGTYAAEGFGTRDLIGNVSEWVEDCWHDSYRRAPSDGRAWVNRGCRERVVRGGSWASTLAQSRSAFRLQVPAELTSARVGFRVVREI